MDADVKSFVSACPVCAQNKSSTQPSAGLLRPLPVPRCPWSHLALDFVTGLPASAGNAVILTVVDRFSKFTRFFASAQTAVGQGDGRSLGPRGVLCVRAAFRYRFRSWVSIHFRRLESFLFCCWRHNQFVLWIPSSIKWSSRKSKPGSRDLPSLHGVLQPLNLVHPYSLGGICP